MTEATTTTGLTRPTAGEAGMLAGRALTWGAAVLLSVYLGLSGGGYDIVVRSEIGLVVWWFVLLGVLVGVLPRARIPAVGWIAVGLLAGFLIWTWIGLSWTSSHELTLDDVCMLSTYLGVLVLGLCALTLGSARALINGLACGIAAVSAAAIMSKLAPSLFPANTASSFYNTARLSYPFNYADGVGEYAALGLPLVLYMATSGRTLAGRAVATAALHAHPAVPGDDGFARWDSGGVCRRDRLLRAGSRPHPAAADVPDRRRRHRGADGRTAAPRRAAGLDGGRARIRASFDARSDLRRGGRDRPRPGACAAGHAARRAPSVAARLAPRRADGHARDPRRGDRRCDRRVCLRHRQPWLA